MAPIMVAYFSTAYTRTESRSLSTILDCSKNKSLHEMYSQEYLSLTLQHCLVLFIHITSIRQIDRKHFIVNQIKTITESVSSYLC